MIQEEQNSKPTPPRILILSGWVGSGKSTFATQLEQANPGKSIIIDRQNFDRKQRLTWLRIAKEIEDFLQEQQQQEGEDDIALKIRVECDLIEFATPFEECVTRLRYRTGHETIHSFEEGIRVLKSISNKEWVSPDISEVESPTIPTTHALMLTADRAYTLPGLQSTPSPAPRKLSIQSASSINNHNDDPIPSDGGSHPLDHAHPPEYPNHRPSASPHQP
ncbi:hypothetical protein PGTUg99_013486 [Puccinia graminis f. sp. tritici]|uniref:Uncharacterized protein n=1 Tax=Puccinia graminis f. sp. tritici TaxID=56615 RepID=A0A5B0PL34_PUCGR|nr:hypothetical protein PGTUg99_013486 [Puccinia graminis f. sp. tritici]